MIVLTFGMNETASFCSVESEIPGYGSWDGAGNLMLQVTI
jgi:hypothetical protein